jgi:hypothetical protein
VHTTSYVDDWDKHLVVRYNCIVKR